MTIHFAHVQRRCSHFLKATAAALKERLNDVVQERGFPPRFFFATNPNLHRPRAHTPPHTHQQPCDSDEIKFLPSIFFDKCDLFSELPSSSFPPGTDCLLDEDVTWSGMLRPGTKHRTIQCRSNVVVATCNMGCIRQLFH